MSETTGENNTSELIDQALDLVQEAYASDLFGDMATVIAGLTRALSDARSLDPKTRLLNYPTFQEIAERKIADPPATNRRQSSRGTTDRRSYGKYSLLVADLDDFKHVNTVLGYHGADATCLLPTAQILTSNVLRRDGDISRFGGEEFAVLLEGTDSEGAIRVADRIRAQVNQIALPAETGNTFLGITIASISFDPGSSYGLAFDVANEMLTFAKSNGGKNQVVAGNLLSPELMFGRTSSLELFK
jgi:diguanylate cyclase (GGDEF)-like protein